MVEKLTNVEYLQYYRIHLNFAQLEYFKFNISEKKIFFEKVRWAIKLQVYQNINFHIKIRQIFSRSNKTLLSPFQVLHITLFPTTNTCCNFTTVL